MQPPETETAIIVPARLASQRFPRKLLHPILGKPLILWTATRLQEVTPEFPVYFAVGDAELADVLEAAGHKAILTDPNLPSGTDRIAAANEQVQARYVLNVQADEPLVSKEQIQALSDLVRREDVSMATLAVRFKTPKDFLDSNRVKVVTDRTGRALYFSRSPIPYSRDNAVDDAFLERNPAYLHLGLYAYKRDFLAAFTQMEPGYLEQLEKLEQLRALEHGHAIAVGIVEKSGHGIDTPADSTHLEKILQGR